MTVFKKVEYIDAVRGLVGGRVAGLRQGPLSELRFYDNQELPTEEEIQAKLIELKAADPIRLLRLERNTKLAETDWIIVKGLEQSIDLTEWKTYRQALRDLPATANPQLDSQGNLVNVTWPEVPE